MTKLLFALALLFSARHADAGELAGVLSNNQGVKKFGEQKPVEAFDSFTRALGELPYAGEVHFNLGNSFLQTKEFDKAMSEYAQAGRHSAGDDKRAKEVRFRALFNAAVASTELKKNDDALELYQQALEIKPDSVETKTNMELLTAGGQGEGEGEGNGKGGKGKDQDKKDDKQDQKKDQQQPQKFDNPKPTPRKFQPDQVTEQDVKRILEELKRQEEQIRARMQNQGGKDAPPAKDW